MTCVFSFVIQVLALAVCEAVAVSHLRGPGATVKTVEREVGHVIHSLEAAAGGVAKSIASQRRSTVQGRTSMTVGAYTYETYPSTNCYLHDLNHSTNVTTEEDCALSCASTRTCAAYVWCHGEDCDQGEFTCWLKDSGAVDCLKEGFGKSPGRSAGIVTGSTAIEVGEALYRSSVFETLDDTLCEGHDHLEFFEAGTNLPVSSMEDCKDLCNSAADCAVFIYGKCPDCDVNASHGCWLKDNGCVSVLRKTEGQSPGFIAGIKPGVAGANPDMEVEIHEALKAGLISDETVGKAFSVNASINATNGAENATESDDLLLAFETLGSSACHDDYDNVGSKSGHSHPVWTMNDCKKLCLATKGCAAVVMGDCDGCPKNKKRSCWLKDDGCVRYIREHVGQAPGFTVAIKPVAEPSANDTSPLTNGTDLEADNSTEGIWYDTDVSENATSVEEVVCDNSDAAKCSSCAQDKCSNSCQWKDPFGCQASINPESVHFDTLAHSNCPGHAGGLGTVFKTEADLQPVQVLDSMKKCQHACAKHQYCGAFAFCWQEGGCANGHGLPHVEMNTCFLKDKGCIPWLKAHEGEGDGFVAGIRLGHVDMNYDCYESGVMYSPQLGGEESSSTEEESIEDCQALCAKTADCEYFSYLDTKACLLHDHTAKTKPWENAKAGPAKCPDQQQA